MLEEFTDRARRVVALTQEEAARLGHGQAETGHLLLGLLSEGDNVAARALSSLGITIASVGDRVEAVGGRGEEGSLNQGPVTPRMARVLELSPREARRFGQESVAPEHLLLALIREANCVGVRVLDSLGANPADVRREVLGRIRNPSRADDKGLPPPEPEEPPAAHKEAEHRDEQVRQETEDTDEGPTTLFRARVEDLRVHVRCGVSEAERGLPQTLLVDLHYVYEARPGDDLDGVVDYGSLIEEAAKALEREEFKLLETGTRRIGARVLELFPAVREIAVVVTKPGVPIARPVSGVSVRAVFRR